MKALFLFSVVVGTLALFNPDEEAFETFVRERTQDVVTEHARSAAGSLLGSAAGALGAEVAGALAGGAVERSSYVAFSVYTLDLNGPREPGGEWRFLGVAGQFFELERPAMMQG